jgi:hypothetical protein
MDCAAFLGYTNQYIITLLVRKSTLPLLSMYITNLIKNSTKSQRSKEHG